MQDADILNSDVKALLILLLLKTGTSAEEIATALKMAATSRLVASQGQAVPDPTPDIVADVDRRLSETNKPRPAASKPPIRSVPMPPIKAYAA